MLMLYCLEIFGDLLLQEKPFFSRTSNILYFAKKVGRTRVQYPISWSRRRKITKRKRTFLKHTIKHHFIREISTRFTGEGGQTKGAQQLYCPGYFAGDMYEKLLCKVSSEARNRMGFPSSWYGFSVVVPVARFFLGLHFTAWAFLFVLTFLSLSTHMFA
jgi:hypothetical protein